MHSVYRVSIVATANIADGEKQPEFKLYYWPGIAGCGEFTRLLFAETETPYVAVPFLRNFFLGEGKPNIFHKNRKRFGLQGLPESRRKAV